MGSYAYVDVTMSKEDPTLDTSMARKDAAERLLLDVRPLARSVRAPDGTPAYVVSEETRDGRGRLRLPIKKVREVGVGVDVVALALGLHIIGRVGDEDAGDDVPIAELTYEHPIGWIDRTSTRTPVRVVIDAITKQLPPS